MTLKEYLIVVKRKGSEREENQIEKMLRDVIFSSKCGKCHREQKI